jgi:hypothetical protein
MFHRVVPQQKKSVFQPLRTLAADAAIEGTGLNLQEVPAYPEQVIVTALIPLTYANCFEFPLKRLFALGEGRRRHFRYAKRGFRDRLL